MPQGQVAAEPTSTPAAAPSGTETTSPVQTATTPNGQTSENTQSQAPTTPSADTTPDWWNVLDGIDTKELAKHPKFSGLVGNHAERIAKQRIEKEREEIKRQAQEQAARDQEQARLDYLRQTDKMAFLEELDRVEARRNAEARQLEAEQAQRNAAWQEVNTVFDNLFYNAPEEVRQKLGGKQYNAETPGEARMLFLQDLFRETSAYEARQQSAKAVADARSKWESEELPARIKQQLGETVGEEPSPDSGGGTSSGGDNLLSQTEFDQHRSSLEWRRANIKRISDAVAAGRIRR